MKNNKAVYLEWVDSFSTTGNVWCDNRHVKNRKPDRCRTIGFIISETKDLVTVVNSFDGVEDGCVSGDMTIPKCAIRKRRVVSWKK